MAELFSDADDMPADARGFVASYATECEFGDMIEPGERIYTRGDGEWAHVACIDRDGAVPARMACSSCFLVHATNQVECDG